MPENNTPETKMHIPSEFSDRHHAKLGPILGALVILLVLIFVALYLWGSMLGKDGLDQNNPLINNEPETTRAEADKQIMETLSPSDELDAIAADVESTNLQAIDSDLTTIDAELNQAIPE